MGWKWNMTPWLENTSIFTIPTIINSASPNISITNLCYFLYVSLRNCFAGMKCSNCDIFNHTENTNYAVINAASINGFGRRNLSLTLQSHYMVHKTNPSLKYHPTELTSVDISRKILLHDNQKKQLNIKTNRNMFQLFQIMLANILISPNEYRKQIILNSSYL